MPNAESSKINWIVWSGVMWWKDALEEMGDMRDSVCKRGWCSIVYGGGGSGFKGKGQER